MHYKIKHILPSIILGMFAGILSGFFYFGSDKLDPCSPYRSVSTNYIQWEDKNTIIVSANFIKNGRTTFDSLKVYGESFLEWENLDWKDINTPLGDRLAGNQTLKIKVGSEKDKYTKYEIRTRHICDKDDKKIDKVFLSFYAHEINEEKLKKE